MGNKLTVPQIVGLVIGVIILGPLYWLFSEPGVLKKMWVIVTYNYGFWIAILIAIVFGIYRKFTNPEKFTWLELPVQLIAGVVGTFIIFSTLFYTTTNISDIEIWNGYVKTAVYLEEWTEETTTEECDSDGKNCHPVTTRTYHPPEWFANTNNDEKITLSEREYKTYVKYYGGEKKQNLFHMNQVSIGDGDKFYVNYSGKTKPVWTAIEHPFINYLTASESIKLRRGSMDNFKNLLLPYPRVHGGPFGPIEVDRVLSAGVKIPTDWRKKLDRGLDESLVHLGQQKQVNVLVYLVNTSDESFLHALEEYWTYGKKNDVIVIIGTTNFPKIDWVSVMAWTDVEEFKITLRNNIIDFSDLSDATKLVKTIISQVSLPPSKGGFLRKPMVEYEYLVSDITLPWWGNILIFLILALFNWVVSWALINNDIKTYTSIRRFRR